MKAMFIGCCGERVVRKGSFEVGMRPCLDLVFALRHLRLIPTRPSGIRFGSRTHLPSLCPKSSVRVQYHESAAIYQVSPITLMLDLFNISGTFFSLPKYPRQNRAPS